MKGRKTGGRQKGTPNKVNAAPRDAKDDVQAFCQTIVSDPAYQESFKQRLYAGKLAPALEAMAWHYGFGKPIERQEHTGPDGGPLQSEHRVIHEIHTA